MSNYVLENTKEFERLEKQSQNEAYDYRAELRGFTPKETGRILDAGCGSGVVARYLAQLYPNASISGCDASIDRVTQATILAQDIPNLKFRVENLNQMTSQNSSYDAIVCRYVLEHLPEEACATTLQEFYLHY